MAQRFCGKDFIVSIGDGGSPEQFDQVGGMTATSMSVNGEEVDITDKDDGAWKVTLDECGILSMSISLSGHITDSATLEDLQLALLNRTSANFKLESGLGDEYLGAFRVTKVDRNGEVKGVEQYSVTLSSNGAVTYTPAT
jgi:TP901-1 family phage major tail protein